ncbi:MAG: ATP-dependent RecD-like DNA helicase [Lachnospira eligens]
MKYVEGFVENIIFRNEDNGYTVFNIVYDDEEITCVGVLSYINTGEFITAQGEFVKHAVYYMQFKVTSYEFRAPDDAASVRRYLSSGAIKGIGEKMAERIVKTFGDDTFRIMEEEPERLAEIKGISMSKAMDIANQLIDKKDIRKAMMFLQRYGIQMNLANKIFKRYGNDIYNILEQNPYRLADDIEGVGFRTADEIASRAGIKIDSEFRIKSGIFYVLNQATMQGHTYLPYDKLVRQVNELLLIDVQDYDKYLMDLTMDKKIVVKVKDNVKCVYARMYYNMEANVAAMLNNLDVQIEEDQKFIDDRIARIEDKEGITLDDIQKEAVAKAVRNGLVIVTGGPGTGKTTTINTIIKYFELEGLEIRLAAPTGRAAKRMTEACGYEAQTIHRMLEISGGVPDDDRKSAAGLSMFFERNEDNPLEADVIIVDEMSMVDISIMNSLLKAVSIGTKLILVGDVDQLPSVGPGNVLKDIIESGCFPVVKLERIFRQAAQSEIIINAHKINRGEEVVLNKYSKDFLFVHRNGADNIINAMKTLIKYKLPDYVGADVYDLQILTPSRKSNVGVERLNKIMQDFLNPADAIKQERQVGDVTFREGDKVMQIKNDYQLAWEKRSRYGIPTEQGTGAFNGDTGVIERISTFDENVTVKFEDGRFVTYEFSQLDELELAYAITVHKSQGSEYPAVIIPMSQGPRMLMNRNILYTAVTRARKCVCLVGEEEIFRLMAGNVSESKRYSSLTDRIL